MRRVANLLDIVCVTLAGYRYKSFLDLGCGWGDLSKAVKNIMPELDVYGVDISKPYIDFAKQNNNGVKFLVGDVRRLPFKDKQFDLVFTKGTFIHIPKRQIKSAIKEVLRISKNYFFIESSMPVKVKKTKKYDCKKYWTKRAFKREPDKDDVGIEYYFNHDYEKLFKELGVKMETTELESTNNTRMYLSCKPNGLIIYQRENYVN